MTMTHTLPSAPTEDKRWRIAEATMRRNGFEASGLIETLHSVQQAMGFLDESALRWVAASLRVPLSKIYGVATFYHHFTLKPQGRHTCVVCLGTACYIKGSKQLLEQVEKKLGIHDGQTTADGEISLLVARCIGACGLAPAAVVDGQVQGKSEATMLLERLDKVLAGKVTS